MLFFKLSAFYFFYFAAVGVYVIFLPKVLHDLEYTAMQIGIVFALAPLMRFITPFLFLKHIKLNQNVFKAALFLSIFCSISFYLTIENFYFFMVNNAILGASLSLILPYLEVNAIKILGKDKYGRSRLFGSIGFILVAILLGQFLTHPFVALHYYLFVNVLTVVFALLLLKYDDVKHDESLSSEPFSFFKYWPFWVAIFFMQLSFGGFYNFFTIYETEHGVSLQMASFMWSFGVICEIILFYSQAPLLKRNLLHIIKFCLSLTILRWFLLFVYPENIIITFFTQSIHAFSFGLFHSAVIIYLYSLYENKKLAQQFMYGVAYGLGGFMGALIAGWLYGEYLFLYSAIFALFALISISNKRLPNTI
ncbi:MFS transporter [Halarcobacter ebronensis]|uniref:MFS transporter n=1 Tax=Halarcobacter ebronensis TaxID=1462615 RepID=A0A4Q1AU84_9BACT|nr:MFS transporter [Halarcobacter ebronensis]QKF83434.1 putative major facilitator superfamily transporter [Halarcobacter ebronensis]RXK08235.1 MFS transporter [Halarcobacter ebronensis]